MEFQTPPSRAARHDRAARTRTVSWQDPIEALERLRATHGLDYLRAMSAWEVPAPPMARLLGIDIEAIEEGRVVMALEPEEHLYNPQGVVHGGLLATLLDTVMGCAVHTRLVAGEAYTTTDLHVQFVRPVTTASGRLVATGEVVHLGRTTATATARVVDAAGRLCAHGSSTLVVRRPRGDGAAGEA